MATAQDSAAERTERVVWVRQLITLFVWAVVVALLFQFFKPFLVLFLGILAAGSLAAALYPIMRWVPASRPVSAVIVGIMPVALSVAAVLGTSWMLAEPIRRETERWPELRERLNATLAGWSERFGMDEPMTLQSVLGNVSSVFGDGGEVLSTTTGVLSGAAIALVFLFFGSIYLLVSSPRKLVATAVEAMSPNTAARVLSAFDDLVPRLRWWVIGTLFSMSVVGAAAWAGYAIVGLDFALPLALLTGLAEIVPTVGPALAFLVALLFATTQGASTVIGVAVVYAVIQLIESYILIPLVMKEAVKMPPVVTLFTVVLWGKVFGAGGLLLAIPINLVIWSFYDHLVLRPRKQAIAR